MTGGTRAALVAALIFTLGGCVSGSTTPPQAQPRPVARPGQPASPPASPPTGQVDSPVPSSTGFLAPQVMRLPGLENVIGRDAAQLQQRFGKARLDIAEGDARKLQFSDKACVLDIWLYPLRPGAAPVATHVEARRASDGRDVDRAGCVAALDGVKR